MRSDAAENDPKHITSFPYDFMRRVSSAFLSIYSACMRVDWIEYGFSVYVAGLSCVRVLACLLVVYLEDSLSCGICEHASDEKMMRKEWKKRDVILRIYREHCVHCTVLKPYMMC